MKRVLFILGVLEDEDIDWLVTIGDRQEIAQGTTLIQEGVPTDAIYILLEGILHVCVSSLKHQVIARLSTGEVVGEMSFVDRRPPSATVEAATSSLVLTIPRQALSQKLEQDLGFAARFYRALAILLSSRLRGMIQQLDEASQWQPLELSPTDLNGEMDISLAAIRFDWLLRRLRDGDIGQSARS
ncbi:MAG: cyclic nucleotide-binding domain-containing protein [Cyanobacteria bacterium P01_A01_bin.123]